MSFASQAYPALGAALALLTLVAVYLAWGLPRLGGRVALAATAAATLALVLGATLSGSPTAAIACAIAAAALVGCHAGWLHGRRSLRRPPKPAEPRGTQPPGAAALRESAAIGQPAPLHGGVPARLGRYRIERLLARGAMGSVYLGVDPAIGREVAIKTMSLGEDAAADEAAEVRQRFFREAEAAGRLQHPGIVTVFDVGEDRGLAYIAMELLKGSDLRPHCRAGQLLAMSGALEIGARVAEALGYAHMQGVIHRDVKPANIVVDLASGSVKITDFGIARLADWSRTRTGVMLGTPSYMSPEQLLGQPLDGRADLYSLGAVLFELLTGRLPHEAASASRLMQMIVNESAPDIRALRPELPASLSPVLARALEKKPQARYADGVQFAQALRMVAREGMAE